MLSYELCKRLKEAGFPQLPVEVPPVHLENFTAESDGKVIEDMEAFAQTEAKPGETYRAETIMTPTVEQMLSEMGADFRQLVYLQGGYSDPEQRWFAYGRGDVSTIGHNPAEALAYLYLGLREKK